MKMIRAYCCMLALLVLAGCRTPLATLYQVGTIDALLAGQYDGTHRCSELLAQGDTGLGTFDALDGEMMVLDGVIYQIRSDGKVYSPAADACTPFAAVAPFQASATLKLADMDFDAFKAAIDKACPAMNTPLAVVVHGRFKHVHTRSVPKQSKPYRPLAEVTKVQPEFQRDDVTGTLVGLRLPPFVQKINVTGHHFHFLADDHQFGGHVLGFDLADADADICVLDSLLLSLPVDNAAFQAVDFTTDRAGELTEVEH